MITRGAILNRVVDLAAYIAKKVCNLRNQNQTWF